MPEKLRIVGYCRTSGEGQRDNTSIANQKKTIEGFAARNDWKFVGHFVDECRSGAKTEGRDQFQAMLRDAANKKFEVVVPFDATRLARDGVDIVSTAKVLKSEFGVFVVDAKGQFDNRDHRNALRNFVQAGVSEHERLTIMERMLGARVDKARAGLLWCGKAPIGRTFRKTGKQSGEWSVNETGRKLAALLTRYAAGEPMSALAKEYRFHDAAHVLRHVRDGQLAARPYCVTFHTPEVGIVSQRVEVPAVPPIISAALDRRVRDRLEHNRTWNKQALRRYLLSGFVRCSHCGAALTSQQTDGVAYYRHHPRTGTGGKECGFRSVRGDTVETPVLGYLYRWFVDQPAFDLAITMALPQASDRKQCVDEVKRANTDLKKVEAEISRLVDAIGAGADPQLLIGKQQQLKEQREAIGRRQKEASEALAAMPDPDAVREEAEVLRAILAQDHISKDWRKESFDDIRRFLHFLFGDNPKRENLGVFVGVTNGRWSAEVRARLRLREPEYLIGGDSCGRVVGWTTGTPTHEFASKDTVHLVRTPG